MVHRSIAPTALFLLTDRKGKCFLSRSISDDNSHNISKQNKLNKDTEQRQRINKWIDNNKSTIQMITLGLHRPTGGSRNRAVRESAV